MGKKRMVTAIAAVMLLVFTLAACGQSGGSAQGNQNSGSARDGQGGAAAGDSSTLVAYFSWSGNTEEMASYIAEQTGGDLYEIQPETPYPTDYNECGDVALEERDSDARPAIAKLPDSIDQYDRILIGYPIWLAYHKLIQCTQIA